MELMIANNALIYLKIYETTLQNYYSSKLCFLNEGFDDGKKIVIHSADYLGYNKEIEEYFFPCDITTYQQCFLFRLVIDSLQLKRGNLPLHAAAVSDGKQTIIIVAKPGKGKSYISDTLCNLFPECYTIGDDHIIITSDHIQGNLKRRIRSLDGKICRYRRNTGLDTLHPMVFICFELEENIQKVYHLSLSQASEYFSVASAFKYLNEIFIHNKQSYQADVLTDIDIREVYSTIFHSFLDKNEILLICGTQEYAIKYISSMIKEGRR